MTLHYNEAYKEELFEGVSVAQVYDLNISVSNITVDDRCVPPQLLNAMGGLTGPV